MLPGRKANFLQAIAIFHEQYSNADNDFKKGLIYRSRANALRSALKGNYEVEGWTGTVYKLSSNGDGFGVIEVTLRNDVWVTTWNNSFSDMGDHTLIQPSSPVYPKLSGLKEGDVVSFSGHFKPEEDADVVKTNGMSMESKMTEPEFLFQFTTIKKE